jgi:hypothetical protein
MTLYRRIRPDLFITEIPQIIEIFDSKPVTKEQIEFSLGGRLVSDSICNGTEVFAVNSNYGASTYWIEATRAMRPSYRDAVDWIALNDNAGNGDNEAAVSWYISTILVADIFGRSPEEVGRDIMRVRARNTLTKVTP